MPKGISALRQWSARILCAVVLLFAGIPQQAALADAGQPSPIELAQYRLPDGSLPIICVTYTDADGNQHGKALTPNCEMGQMAAAVIMPSPQTDISERLVFAVEIDVPLKPEAFRRHLYPPNTGPRAPPLSETVG